MVEYSTDQNLLEMANEVRGKSDRFLRVSVKKSKDEFHAFEIKGDQTQLLEGLLKGASEGYIKVQTQSIGTYTED